jgi:hypothetical protein|tara:strand:- start:366 stop:641 length:276 start_codon:yes stop_codon:yes gene_type:complete
MIINFGDKWRLKSDSHQWVVQYHRVPENASEGATGSWVSRTYHVNPEDAVESMLQLRIRLADTVGLSDCLKEMRAIKKDIMGVFNDYYGDK